jgi:PTH1 family peptidyl-tRNA hydrolase
VQAAADFLQPFLHDGDLVVLKGSMNADHLGRLAHHWLEPISCWRMDCGKNMPCSVCSALRADVTSVSRQAGRPPAATVPPSRQFNLAVLPQCTTPMEVLVGIGNPGERYQNTPHNVGVGVLDAMVERLDLTWSVHDDVALAHGKLNGKTILLAKPQTYVNNTGKCLKELSEALGFRAEDCVLIQDDIHLPLGKLRSRARGSDGGHKGVRSVLVTFQTDEFRRLKIGVAPTGPPPSAAEYLTTPFTAEAAATIDPAINAAVDRLLSMLGARVTERQ